MSQLNRNLRIFFIENVFHFKYCVNNWVLQTCKLLFYWVVDRIKVELLSLFSLMTFCELFSIYEDITVKREVSSMLIFWKRIYAGSWNVTFKQTAYTGTVAWSKKQKCGKIKNRRPLLWNTFFLWSSRNDVKNIVQLKFFLLWRKYWKKKDFFPLIKLDFLPVILD